MKEDDKKTPLLQQPQDVEKGEEAAVVSLCEELTMLRDKFKRKDNEEDTTQKELPKDLPSICLYWYIDNIFWLGPLMVFIMVVVISFREYALCQQQKKLMCSDDAFTKSFPGGSLFTLSGHATSTGVRFDHLVFETVEQCEFMAICGPLLLDKKPCYSMDQWIQLNREQVYYEEEYLYT